MFLVEGITPLFKNELLESDKFLILLLKIVKKKFIAGAFNSFQDLAESSVVCFIYAKLFSSTKKKKEQVV